MLFGIYALVHFCVSFYIIGYISYKISYYIWDTLENGIKDIPVFTTVILFCVIGIGLYQLDKTLEDTSKYYQKYNKWEVSLVALEDGTSTNGGRYYSRTEHQYNYAYRDGGYKATGHINDNLTKIDENNRGDNRLECYTYSWSKEYSFMKYVFPESDLSSPDIREGYYIIHCPDHTVSNKFNIDLK